VAIWRQTRPGVAVFDGHYLHPARTTAFRDTGICVGRGVLNAAIAISISHPQYYRVVRNHTQSVKLNYLSKPPKPWVHPPGVLSLPVSQRNSERASVVPLNAADAILTLGGLGLGLGLPEVAESGA